MDKCEKKIRYFSCDLCSKKYKKLKNLKLHKIVHEPKKCELCKAAYDKIEDLQRHILEKHTKIKKTWNCKICNKMFLKSKALSRHMYVHNEDRPFPCQLCSGTFKRKVGLTKHLVTHTDDRPFRCKICDAKFKLKETLRRHLPSHLEASFECDTCDKMYKTKQSLLRHKTRCSSQMQFECEFCDTGFTSKNQLSNHSNIHALGAKPYTCDICNEIGFKNKEKFILHRIGHSEVNPSFKCENCDEMFKQRSLLQAHQIVHSQPFECDKCQVRFTFNYNLKNHKCLQEIEEPEVRRASQPRKIIKIDRFEHDHLHVTNVDGNKMRALVLKAIKLNKKSIRSTQPPSEIPLQVVKQEIDLDI